MRLVSLTFFIFLCACQSLNSQNENSPYYQIPAGSTLTLNKEIDVPAGKAAVYIQNGQIVDSSGQVHEYDPYCNLEMRAIKDVPQPVKSDQFVVLKSKQETKLSRADFMLLASNNLLLAGKMGGGPSQKLQSTLLDLRSEKQPEVFRLTCQRWDTRTTVSTPLTVGEIRKTLSDVFALKLAGGG